MRQSFCVFVEDTHLVQMQQLKRVVHFVIQKVNRFLDCKLTTVSWRYRMELEFRTSLWRRLIGFLFVNWRLSSSHYSRGLMSFLILPRLFSGLVTKKV